MQTLKTQLLKEAHKLGLCKEFHQKIATAENITQLIELLWQGIDFCISQKFPNQNLMVQYKEILEENGIFRNQVVANHVLNKIWLLGDCNAYCDAFSYDVKQLYVCEESQLESHIVENSFVIIDAFDAAKINVFAYDKARVLVNLYGNATAVHRCEDTAYVKIIHKNKSTY